MLMKMAAPNKHIHSEMTGDLSLTPSIKAISPSEGCMSGGTSVVIVGEGFFDGIQVVFNGTIVYAEVRPT